MTNQKLAFVGALQSGCLAQGEINNANNFRKAGKQNLEVAFLLLGLLKQ
jgi:hypothetical protein